MKNNVNSLDNVQSGREAFKSIEEYYKNKHSGPLDLESTIRGLDSFIERLNGETWKVPQNTQITISKSIENIEPSGENNTSTPLDS